MFREDMTFNEALDKVKSFRETRRQLVGTLYPNVLADQVQTFLEKCIQRWGPRFMECVERERSEEVYGKDIAASTYKEKGKRD